MNLSEIPECHKKMAKKKKKKKFILEITARKFKKDNIVILVFAATVNDMESWNNSQIKSKLVFDGDNESWRVFVKNNYDGNPSEENYDWVFGPYCNNTSKKRFTTREMGTNS